MVNDTNPEDRTVLVVDDDKDLLGLVEVILEGEGYTIATATDGESALAQVERKMPAVILLDMRMPGMDGWEFARQFHSRYGRSAPIVVMTAAEDARQRAQEIGAEGYLPKPFEIDDVARCVEKFVRTDGEEGCYTPS